MTAAILQARMGSTRLPGKVMKIVLGKPLLWQEIARLRRTPLLRKVIVATTENQADDIVVSLAQRMRIPYFRGSEDDVLDRYYQAAKTFGVSTVVRITGDCPLIDPAVVNDTIRFFRSRKFDYVSNVNPPTFPDGMDAEVFSFRALRKAWREASLPSEREHVTSFIWKHPRRFKIGNFASPKSYAHIRLTVDDPKDLILVKKIFYRLYPRKRFFTLQDIVQLLEAQPGLLKINAGTRRNEGYLKSLKKDAAVLKGDTGLRKSI